jgi:signal peptidase I
MRSHWLRRIGVTLFTVSAVVVLVALATGVVRLVTTHGVSMEPRFHTGDLAVIVRAPSYHVGEIVGYYSPLLHIIVLHRIVAEHAGRFTFKGDNNSFLDPLKLPSSYVRGSLLLHIPDGGTVLGWFRTPLGLGAVAFAFVAFGTTWTTRRHRIRARRTRARRRTGIDSADRGTLAPGPRHAAPKTTTVPRWPVLVPAACVGLCCVVSLAAWVHPLTRPGSHSVPYRQQINFSYTARTPRGVAYPTGAVQTGEPVFVKLADAVEVTARYRFLAGATPAAATPAALGGTIGATVDLEGPPGWSGQVSSVGPVRFSGTTASVHVEVDVARVSALEHAFTQETGVPIPEGDIVVIPTVHVHGSVDGSPVRNSFSPSLGLQLSGDELSLQPGTSSPGVSGSQLSRQASGSVAHTVSVPATMPVLGAPIGVARIRELAAGALVVSLVACLVVTGWLERRGRMDEPTRIRAAHGHDLVVVSSSPATDAALVVDVETFGGLVRLAERYDCLLLELEHAGGMTYYVECGATVYRYGSEPAAGAAPGPDGDRPDDMTFHVSALRSVS